MERILKVGFKLIILCLTLSLLFSLVGGSSADSSWDAQCLYKMKSGSTVYKVVS